MRGRERTEQQKLDRLSMRELCNAVCGCFIGIEECPDWTPRLAKRGKRLVEEIRRRTNVDPSARREWEKGIYKMRQGTQNSEL